MRSPAELWYKAQAEHPDDRTACRDRYIELMREEGHIVKREPGDDRRNLPCGETRTDHIGPSSDTSDSRPQGQR